MKRYLQIFRLLVLLLFPVTALAQGTMFVGDLDTYVALLNEECPISHMDAWAVNQVTVDGDTVHVEFQIPTSLEPFLLKLTGDDDNVKRLWVRQLQSFGYPWDDLMNRLVEAGRPMVITFNPKGTSKTSEVPLTPEDITAYTEKNQPSPQAKEEPVEDEEPQQLQ